MSDDKIFETVMGHMEAALPKLSAKVRPPVLTTTIMGRKAYRYKEETPQQAIVLKLVRILSALRALRVLVDAGLPLDAGASMRILDELGTDVMLIAGPIVFGTQQEEVHKRYLSEFFQEEWNHPDPLKSTQTRARVSRDKIRAYVARAYSGNNMVVSDVVKITRVVENTNSGYVHGAAGHVIDAFDGRQFIVPMNSGDKPLEDMRDLVGSYAFRSLGAFEVAARALGEGHLWSKLGDLSRKLLSENATLRPRETPNPRA